MKAISFPREGLLSAGNIRLLDGQVMHGPMRLVHGPIIKESLTEVIRNLTQAIEIKNQMHAHETLRD